MAGFTGTGHGEGGRGVIFSAACNRIAQPCGCAEWDQFEHGGWVHKRWVCYGHEIAARRGECA